MSNVEPEGSGGVKAPLVIHPSRAVPPVPSFVFTAPPGWVIDEAPGSVVVVHTPEKSDGFWINTIVTHDRVADEIDLETAARASWERISSETPSAQIRMEKAARFGSNVVYLRGIELDGPSGTPMAQLHAIFFAPRTEGRATADLFQMITTSTPEQMERIGAGLVEMISSFHFV